MSYYQNSYSTGDTFIDYSGNKYTVVTGGNTPSTPFDSSNIVNDLVVWGSIELKENPVGGGGSSGGTVLLNTLYSVNYSVYTAVPLLDSLSNYDYIQVQWYLERAGDITRHFVGYLDCNEILTTTDSTALWAFNENPTNSGSYYCRILFCGDGSGNLRAYGSGSDSVKISKIIGFKI